MEQLRSELIEAERARSDLLKWKLVLVAALGTVALGLTQPEESHPIVLVGIPLVCAYVDLLCRHLTLRLHVIGAFLRDERDIIGRSDDLDELEWQRRFWRKYEAFAEKNRAVFAFEDSALEGSSLLLSLSVVAYGVFLFFDPRETDLTTRVLLVVAGILGAALVRIIKRVYRSKLDLLPGG